MQDILCLINFNGLVVLTVGVISINFVIINKNWTVWACFLWTV